MKVKYKKMSNQELTDKVVELEDKINCLLDNFIFMQFIEILDSSENKKKENK